MTTEANNYYLHIRDSTLSLGSGQELETLHVKIDAFDTVADFNAGTPSLTGFPFLKTDAARNQVIKVLHFEQPSSFEAMMSNVPGAASTQENGWQLQLYGTTANSLSSTLTLTGSDLLAEEAYASG